MLAQRKERSQYMKEKLKTASYHCTACTTDVVIALEISMLAQTKTANMAVSYLEAVQQFEIKYKYCDIA